MGRRARRTTTAYASNVAKLRRFYSGERTPMFVGDEPTAHELDPRTFFLESINAHAPKVQGDLRATVLPDLVNSLQDREVIGLTWDELSDARYAALRSSLESWAVTWGLEPQRWSREPLWMMDAALRLLLKWRERQSTSEFTLTYNIYESSERRVRMLQEVRSIGGFSLLVYGHVLEHRPWLTKPSTDETTEEELQLVGERSPQDIARTIRRAAALVGLKSARKARPGR